jgi:hypothetical protein
MALLRQGSPQYQLNCRIIINDQDVCHAYLCVTFPA